MITTIVTGAEIYIRRNGSFGASCDGTRDTGHHIAEDSGLFTVYSVHDPEMPIVRDGTRLAAELAIAKDWRMDL